MTRIKDDDKTWLHWYWLELGDWVRLNEGALTEAIAWLMVISLLLMTGSRIYFNWL